jgi:2-iminobutanoate/2-iminopropanoate deaminase
MSKRKSIHVEGFSHGSTPIPAASRVGNIVMTGGINGTDKATGKISEDLAEQAKHVFANAKRIIEAAGAKTDDIVKMTFWIKQPAAREAINKEWVAMFPDAESRPARHTLQNDHMAAAVQIQCDAFAVIQG